MKKLFLILILLFFGANSFAQQATINGIHSDSVQGYTMYMFSGDSTELVAGITSGTIDSVWWRQAYWDTGPTYHNFSWASKNNTILAPVGMTSTAGYVYDYHLIVFSGGSTYQTFCRVFTNSAITAQIDCDDTSVCKGTTVNFWTSPSGGQNYTYRVNGSVVQTDTSHTYSSSSLNDGDSVTVTYTDINGDSITAGPIVMTVYEIPDATSVTPQNNPCNDGSEMIFNYTGLSGTGPWTLSFWDTGHTTQYGSNIEKSTTDGTVSVPIPYEEPGTHLKIKSADGCENFVTP